MTREQDWVAQRVSEAREGEPLLTEAVAARMEELLRGVASEHTLKPGQLKKTADELLAHMDPTSPSVESEP